MYVLNFLYNINFGYTPQHVSHIFLTLQLVISNLKQPIIPLAEKTVRGIFIMSDSHHWREGSIKLI